MTEIPLTQGYVALVDDEDAERVLAHKWCAHRNGQRVYAVRGEKNTSTGKWQIVLMHRMIMNAPEGMDIDHVTHDAIAHKIVDNRRKNLRICTRSNNARNQRKTRGTSRFKGVCWDKSRRKWIAQIDVNGRNLHLGGFVNERDAACAYDAAAREHYGIFALTNE